MVNDNSRGEFVRIESAIKDYLIVCGWEIRRDGPELVAEMDVEGNGCSIADVNVSAMALVIMGALASG